jgi:multisubunit Na+/H+ antiporter MnhB subunit
LEVTRLVRIFKYNYKNKEVMEILTLSNLTIYLIIGVIFTFLTDQLIRSSLFIEPFTAGETAVSIILWPFVLCIVVTNIVRRFFNDDNY